MNGRVYDYGLGRFMGVDPFIQFPLNSQSLNPYSYILNNPLSGTDPTGYIACADVKNDKAGSGSCDQALSNGKTVSVDYKIGKSGSISVTTSAANFNAIAADNATRSLNGAPSGQKLSQTGAGSGNGQASQIESSPPKAEKTPLGKNGAIFRSLGGDLNEEAYAQNRVVTLMFSASGQSLRSFQWEVRDELLSRTENLGGLAGYEHQASFSERTGSVNGVDVTSYAAVIQTSKSPVVSIDSERLVGNGWNYRGDLGMHTHGFMTGKYKLSSLDATYLRSAGIYKSAGERADPSWGAIEITSQFRMLGEESSCFWQPLMA
jgi:hypothetical protein